jgi:hypothetical protein
MSSAAAQLHVAQVRASAYILGLDMVTNMQPDGVHFELRGNKRLQTCVRQYMLLRPVWSAFLAPKFVAACVCSCLQVALLLADYQHLAATFFEHQLLARWVHSAHSPRLSLRQTSSSTVFTAVWENTGSCQQPAT